MANHQNQRMDLKSITAALALLGGGTSLAACNAKPDVTEVQGADRSNDGEKGATKDAAPDAAVKAKKSEMKCAEGACAEGACGGKGSGGEAKAKKGEMACGEGACGKGSGGEAKAKKGEMACGEGACGGKAEAQGKPGEE